MTSPGMTVRPARSMTRASEGDGVKAVSPTAAMRPSRMTMEWRSRAGLPLPSMTRALTSAITGASTDTNGLTASAMGGRWADRTMPLNHAAARTAARFTATP